MLSKRNAELQCVLRRCANGDHKRQSDRQIEMGAVFGQIGRNQTGDHPASRQRKADRSERSADPLPAFRNRLIGQAHTRKTGCAVGDLRLHIIDQRLNPDKGDRCDMGAHRRTPAIHRMDR